jgi:hypothetical protein
MPAADIEATIAYVRRDGTRPYYFANNHARDHVPIDPRTMSLTDARQHATSLDAEGFVLAAHRSGVEDFERAEEVAAKHPAEIVELVKAHSGADHVQITAPGILRFSEHSGRAGSRDNSHPARFAHIDATRATSAGFASASAPPGRQVRRYAHFNVWRTFTPPPQDIPLAICNARSVAPEDLLVADAIFDPPNGAEWSFESWVIAHNPAHRWCWFPAMTRDEALIFKTSDSEFQNPVPHVAFDCPPIGLALQPRASIEMRCVAFWFE